MHFHRLIALVGVVIGIVGLFFAGLNTDGEPFLADLAAGGAPLPDGVPTIWGGLDTWAQWMLVILIVVTIVLAFRGARAETYDTTSAGVTGVIGAAMLVYAIIKYLDASDSADELEMGFGALFQQGAVPEAWSVSPGGGFFILILGTVLVLAAGALSLIASNASE